MPTGYTADLSEGGVTLQDFTLRCARAFGVLILMRDDPLDTPIPDEFQPNSYHCKAIKTAKKRLAEVKKWSNARAEREAKKAFDEGLRSSKECGEKSEKSGRHYIAMLKQVGNWVPPTKDHEGLKSFMVEQLAGSLEHDCLSTPSVPKWLSGKQYRAQLIKQARWDISYHSKEHKKEVCAACTRTEWVRKLRQSLNATK